VQKCWDEKEDVISTVVEEDKYNEEIEVKVYKRKAKRERSQKQYQQNTQQLLANENSKNLANQNNQVLK
jgi:hypothetical protein